MAQFMGDGDVMKYAFAFFALLAGCAPAPSDPNGVPIAKSQTGYDGQPFYVWIDPATGCEYLVSDGGYTHGNAFPRYEAGGKHRGCK